MSKVISFNGNNGNVIAKKRKLMKGANHHKRSEVKQYNPFIEMKPDEMLPANRDNFGAVLISNIIRPLSIPSGHTEYWSSWYPYQIIDPAVGTASYERIGNQYFLKYLRLKGYINCRGNIHMTVNWRLVLLRSSIALQGANATEAADAYGTLFKNWEAFNVTGFTNDTLHAAARHNFHKKVVNVDNRELYTRKVIASGTIPANQKRDQIGMLAAGSTSSYMRGNVISIPYGEDYRLVPIDYKIVCNDWIKVGDIRYYLVLETDNILGSVVGSYSASSAGDVSLTRNWADSEVRFNFFCRSYFIDP